MRRSRKERALVEQAARQLTVDPADQSGRGMEIAEESGNRFLPPSPEADPVNFHN